MLKFEAVYGFDLTSVTHRSGLFELQNSYSNNPLFVTPPILFGFARSSLVQSAKMNAACALTVQVSSLQVDAAGALRFCIAARAAAVIGISEKLPPLASIFETSRYPAKDPVLLFKVMVVSDPASRGEMPTSRTGLSTTWDRSRMPPNLSNQKLPLKK